MVEARVVKGRANRASHFPVATSLSLGIQPEVNKRSLNKIRRVAAARISRLSRQEKKRKTGFVLLATATQYLIVARDKGF